MADHKIIIEEGALFDLLLPALECSLAPFHDGTTNEGIEVAGLLWGNEVADRQIFVVRKATVLRMGEHSQDFVVVPSRSIEVMQRAADTHWPHLRFLGGFHTHPWLHKREKEVIEEEGYAQSEADKSIFRAREESRIDIIISICKSKKSTETLSCYLGEMDKEPDYSCLITRFGGISVLIKGYRKTEGNRISSKLTLFCPAVLGSALGVGDTLTSLL